MTQVVPPLVKATARLPLGGDLSTKTGATRLANAVKRAWDVVGVEIEVGVEDIGGGHWVVKSYLQNGLPQVAARNEEENK
jgi:hypothetical protein